MNDDASSCYHVPSLSSYRRQETYQRQHEECRRGHAGSCRHRRGRGLPGRRRQGRRRAAVAGTGGRAAGLGRVGGRRGGSGEHELALGREVGGIERVLVGRAAGGGGPDLPHLVDRPHPGAQLQLAVHPHLPAAAGGVRGEVGGRERDGHRRRAQRHVPRDVVRIHGRRGGTRPLQRHQRLRARHALARWVQAPRHPSARRGRRGHERDGQGVLGRVVRPVQRRAQLRQVLARLVRPARRELLGGAGARRGREARRGQEE
jgi:hypothetical protein